MIIIFKRLFYVILRGFLLGPKDSDPPIMVLVETYRDEEDN